MFNYLRLSYNLLRLANSVLDRRKEKFKKELESLDLNERELNEALDCLIGIKDHLVRKMCIHWLKKKSIILPEDLPKVEMAKGLVKRNRGIDYFKFDSPVEIIDKYTKIEGIKKTEYVDPDSLSELYNKVDLGEGVTIYTVEDTKDGQYAVRKLADSHLGPGFDKWCITGRYPKLYPDKERDDMGMILDSFDYWKNTYNAYPKRLVFKNGKLFAFCANRRKMIVWWDQGDNPFTYIPKFKHLGDDKSFIDKYIYEKGDHFETDVKRMTELDIKRALYSDTVSDDFKAQIIDKADSDTRYDIVRNPKTSIDILVKLASDEDYKIREMIALNSNTPVEVLIKLSEDEDEYVRSKVAENLNTPENILVKLSGDDSEHVRSEIAQNSNTPVEILIKLSSDEFFYVRSCVAENPNTPENILVKLSSDEDSVVRQFVAGNPNIPTDVLVKLSKDKEEYVRSKVAENLNTPENILVKLSGDDSEHVRSEIAQNSNTPVEILIKLSSDEKYTVRYCVAENPNTPENILVKLSSDEDSVVRQFVAGNPNIPTDVLVKLSKDKEEYVRHYAKENLRSRGIDV